MYTDAESPSNVSESPPSVSLLASSIVLQQEGIVNQPPSTPTSPLSSLSSPVTHLNLSSPEDCTQDPNWQATKTTVRERNAAMFNNHLMADIIFIVGSEVIGSKRTIPAHKYVLATGSSVFYAMFYGGLAENKQNIEVPDVEPAAFLALLRYMYCDEVELEAETVLATLYAAKKYIVPHLARACVNYLETNLTAKNACLLLSQSGLVDEPKLTRRCWEVIDAQVSNKQKTLHTSMDIMTDESNFLCGHAYYSCKSDCIEDELRKLQYERAFQRKLRVNDTFEKSISDISLVPHCFSLSEIVCYSSIDTNRKLIPFLFFRCLTEPHLGKHFKKIQLTPNIMYRNSFVKDYECIRHIANINDLSDSRYSKNHDLSKIVVKTNGVIM